MVNKNIPVIKSALNRRGWFEGDEVLMSLLKQVVELTERLDKLEEAVERPRIKWTRTSQDGR
jgi:hypothetical protein